MTDACSGLSYILILIEINFFLLEGLNQAFGNLSVLPRAGLSVLGCFPKAFFDVLMPWSISQRAAQGGQRVWQRPQRFYPLIQTQTLRFQRVAGLPLWELIFAEVMAAQFGNLWRFTAECLKNDFRFIVKSKNMFTLRTFVGAGLPSPIGVNLVLDGVLAQAI